MSYDVIQTLREFSLMDVELARAQDGSLVELHRMRVELRDRDHLTQLPRAFATWRALNDARFPKLIDVVENGECAVVAHTPMITLEQLFQAAPGGVALPLVVTVALEVSAALKSLHERDIVHRDIAPDGIGISRDGRVRVRLPLLVRLVTNPNAPRAGMIIGHMRFLSPEMARDEQVTRTSDSYVLGVVLYELLAGKRAYPNANTDLEALMAIVRNDIPHLGNVRSDLPDDIVLLVMNMLDANPSRRPDVGFVNEVLRGSLDWAIWTPEQCANEVRALLPQEYDAL
jgi:serine/threonine protein kinase